MRKNKDQEKGGITILVVLLLLVLLTIAAVAMSKNSIREAIIVGTVRQGADVRETADSGIDWAVFWLNNEFIGNGTQPTGIAATIASKAHEVVAAGDRQGAGQVFPAQGDMVDSTDLSKDRKFDLTLTYMGTIRSDLTSPGIKLPDAISPTDFNLWSVRSDASVDYSKVNGSKFVNSREAWFTAPPLLAPNN